MTIPLVLTAPTAPDLAALAGRVATTPVGRGGLPALGRDLAARADVAHAHRVVVLAGGPDDVARVADTTPAPPVAAGPLAFLFSGQSSQRPGMGEGLAAAYPPFAATLAAVDDALEGLVSPPRREVVGGDGTLLDRAEHAQPALLAHALALTDLLATLGVVPAVVAGHSFGEVAAAAATGVWSRADACALAAERGRLIGALPPGGGMVAVEAPEHEVTAALPDPDVVLSAVHGERAVVVAGPLERVRTVAAGFAARGVRTAELPVAVAAHSPAMAPVLDPLRAAFAAVPARAGTVPLIGNADAAPGAPHDPQHWVRHCRETVRWSDVVAALRARGTGTYLEIGPSGVLSRLSAGCLPDDEHDALVPAGSVEVDEVSALHAALVALERRGHRVDWAALAAAAG